MKLLFVPLIFCIGYLHYAQNLDSQGSPRLSRILADTEEATVRKEILLRENERLTKEIKDLINGYVVIEELARSKMGMIRQGEILFRVHPVKKEAL